MKKLCLLFVLILAFGLCACQKEPKTLTVYAVEGDALYTAGIEGYRNANPDVTLNVVKFASYEELNAQMTTELLSGKGPDVLLFNSIYSTTDYYKFSQSGVFLPLDSYMSTLKDDSCYTTLLDAGKIGEQQYVLPMSWNLLQIYSTQEAVKQHGYDDAGIYDVLLMEAERLADETQYAAASLSLMRADPLNFFLENTGTVVVDTEKGAFVADKEKVEEAAVVVKSFYDNLKKIQTINTTYKNDFAGAVSHFTFLIEQYSFMHNLRFYQTVYPTYTQQQMYAVYFPQFEGDGLSAQVVHYGGINANTQNADTAWELLQFMLNTPFSTDFNKYDTGSAYYAPVTVAGYENCVVQLETQSGQGPKVRVAPLDQQNAAFLRSVPEKVSAAYIPNPVLGGLVDGCMMDYLIGVASFDACYTELETQIRRYLQE